MSETKEGTFGDVTDAAFGYSNLRLLEESINGAILWILNLHFYIEVLKRVTHLTIIDQNAKLP